MDVEPHSGRMRRRCAWPRNPLAIAYHDVEWGVPVHDDRLLFESLILEGAQAGLSWDTVLAKRESYRAAFDGFDPVKVARYGAARKAALLANPGIIRNRAKVDAAILNAEKFLGTQREFGSFQRYLWEWVDDCYRDSHKGQDSPRPAGSAAGTCNQDLRVLRGGSWSDPPDKLRPAARIAIPSDKRIQIGGFRLARDL